MMVFKFGRGYYHISLNLGMEMENFGLRPLRDDQEIVSIGEERIVIGHRAVTYMEPGIVWAPFIPLIDTPTQFITVMNNLIENNETEF